MSHYEVNSFHINVGAGDGAIHLLCNVHEASGTRVVCRAYMIDGGRSSAVPIIKKTIQCIEAKYYCQEDDGKKLIFDAFIVTHWDEDHYGGLIGYLKEQLLQSYNNNPNNPKKVVIPRARYGNGDLLKHGPPESYFYAPVWPSWTEMEGWGWDTYEPGNKQTLLAILKEGEMAKDLLNVRIGPDWLLGRNIFRWDDDEPQTTRWPNMTTLANLMNTGNPIKNPLDGVNEGLPYPAMYCIAANRRILSNPGVNIMNYTEKNMSSLAFIIAWNETVDQQGTPHVSHYFAGDAHEILEAKLSDWMGNRPIVSMKLSHHGSSSSNPWTNFNDFQPWNIVVSAGNEYGHPRWEVLFCLDVWFMWVKLAGVNARYPPFFPCQWPAFLVQNEDGYFTKTPFSIAKLSDQTEGSPIAGADLIMENVKKLRLEKGIMFAPESPLDAMRTWVHNWKDKFKYPPPDALVRQQVCALTEKIMNRISLLHNYQQGELGQVVKTYGQNPTMWPQEAPGKYIKEILSMMVTSSPTTHPAFEGRVDIYGRNFVPGHVNGRHWTSRKVSKTLEAFIWVNQDEPDNLKMQQFPDLGDDRPRRVDLATGNFKWPSPKELGHIEIAPKDTKTRTHMKKHKRLDSWVDVDFDADTDSSSDESWNMLEEPSSRTKPSARRDIVILRKAVPLHIAPAAVYIASETVFGNKARFPVGANVVPLLKENPLFGFVDTTHFQVFSLAAIPTINVATSLAPDDDLFLWIGRFCTWGKDDGKSSDPPTGFAMTMTTSQWEIDKQTLPQFSIDVPYANGRILNFDTVAGAAYTFSKSNDGGTAVPIGALTNMLISRRTMVYGLNKLDKQLDTNLVEISNYIDFDLDRFPVLKAILGSVTLTLDTDKDFRNAIWFRPGLDYQTSLRLQFHADPGALQSWLQKLSPTISVDKILVITGKEASFSFEGGDDVVISEAKIALLASVSVPTKGFDFETNIGLFEDKVSLCLTLQRPKSQDLAQATKGSHGLLSDLADWLADVLGIKSLGLYDMLDKATADNGAIDDDSIVPRRLELMLDLDEKGNFKSVLSAFIHIECCLKIGRPVVKTMEQMPVLFLVTFGWSKVTGVSLSGKLWNVTPETPFTHYDKALPGYEDHQELQPSGMTKIDPSKQVRVLDLQRLLSTKEGEVVIPTGIPSQIYNCEIGISQKEIWFSGAIRCGDQSTTTVDTKAPPSISLENVQIDASYAWGTKSSDDAAFNLRLVIAVKLFLGGKLDDKEDYDKQVYQAAKLQGQLIYSQGNWNLSAKASDLNMGHLLCFWHQDDQGPVAEFLSKIQIISVIVEYQYTKGSSVPNQLTFDGKLRLGSIAVLELGYYNRGSEDWVFRAGLGAENKLGETVEMCEVLSPFIDDELLQILPEAIRTAKLEGERGEKPLQVIFACQGGLRVLAILINIGSISLWFLQMRQGTGPTKRLLKAVISKVSVDVPLLSTTIDSPWEKLFFMWVQDTTPARTKGNNDTTNPPGITQKEFDNLKTCLQKNAGLTGDDLLLFKETKKPENAKVKGFVDDDREPTPTVIAAGSHLVIVRKVDQKSEVVLDYLFNKGQKPQKKQNMLQIAGKAPQQKAPDSSGSEKGNKAPFKVKLGPLAVDNVGLWFKEGMFGITLDATLLMGPVGLSLIGFSIGVPFNSTYSISNPPPLDEVTWGLQGLAVSLDRPPLTVAGGFLHDTSDPKIDKYAGGLIVGFKPWMFQAIGVYATVSRSEFEGNAITTVSLDPLDRRNQRALLDPSFELDFEDDDKTDPGTFTFCFIFVKLEGPLFSVGFADFAGLVGGFGMNSDIMLPTVEQVIDFPFVKERDQGGNTSPAEEIKQLLKDVWFRPAEGLYWAAAGVRVTAFQMLAANLVLVVQFGGAALLIGVFGVATCDVPALASPVKFAHVELGIVCTFDTNSGVLKLEAQLSPRSFVLAPRCHLTGGLAMYAWFKGDRQKDIEAGDWVLTIGGYHQAFVKPPQYPRPPRLGISWSVDTSLSVVGEAYFAITPKVCMGGGRLHASLSLGALSAWFDAFVDFLMNFEPFYFQLQARLAVGVRFTLDLWLVTVRINAEVSASLDLSGPPFGGVVHVDFWVFGFEVKFGSPPPPPPYAMLDRFWKVVMKSSSSSPTSFLAASGHQESIQESDAQVQQGQDTAPILLTCESGLEPQMGGADQAKKSNKWYVKAVKFSFLATFQFVVTDGNLVETRKVTKDGKDEDETREAEATIDPQYKQVFAKPMQLIYPLHSEATISVTAPRLDQAEDSAIHIMETWKDQKWRITPVISPVPTSTWARYSRNSDPSIVGNRVDDLLKGEKPTMPLVTGLSVQPPTPAPAGDLVNKFDVIKDRMQDVFATTEDAPVFPNISDKQSGSWVPPGPSKSWDQVKETWKARGDRGKKTVDLWAKRLGFDKETIEKDRNDETNKNNKFHPLKGNPPSKLLDRFEQMVPALPLIAVGQR